MRMLRKGAIAALLALAGTSADAQGSVSATFTVSATVTRACAFTTGGAPTDLQFGTFDPFSLSPVDVAGSATLQCTNGTPLYVYISTPGGRQMTGPGGALVIYGIFSDTSRIAVFPSVRPSAANFTGTGAAQIINYYGRLPSQPSIVPSGSYSQQVTFNVEF